MLMHAFFFEAKPQKRRSSGGQSAQLHTIQRPYIYIYIYMLFVFFSLAFQPIVVVFSQPGSGL